MEDNLFQRENIYSPRLSGPDAGHQEFIQWSGNLHFRRSVLTWISLILIGILYPYSSVGLVDDPTAMLKDLDSTMRTFLLVTTVITQWGLFFLILAAIYREQSTIDAPYMVTQPSSAWRELKAQTEQGMASIGLGKLNFRHFAYGIAFLMAAFLILSVLAWFLAEIGLPMSGEISQLIPTDPAGMVLWVLVSFTAGFTEEAMFRGYLMTRLRIVFGIKGWVVPTIISSIVFGVCHAYQGWPGFIVITVYGVMFALLYIRTRSLWPCVIAHFFQDFLALFIPQ